MTDKLWFLGSKPNGKLPSQDILKVRPATVANIVYSPGAGGNYLAWATCRVLRIENRWSVTPHGEWRETGQRPQHNLVTRMHYWDIDPNKIRKYNPAIILDVEEDLYIDLELMMRIKHAVDPVPYNFMRSQVFTMKKVEHDRLNKLYEYIKEIGKPAIKVDYRNMIIQQGHDLDRYCEFVGMRSSWQKLAFADLMKEYWTSNENKLNTYKRKYGQ